MAAAFRDLGPLVGAVDAGTASIRFMVFSASTAELITFHQEDTVSLHPKPGWVEQDPVVMIDTVTRCIQSAVDNLLALEVDPADIVAVGVTNQRETTVAWDRESGKPLYNAILWNDTRTDDTVKSILGRLPQDPRNKYHLQHKCGLPISSYFSALKMRWLLDNVESVQKAFSEKRLCFGTVDSWLMYNLSGRAVHITDVTNASRTMLLNLETLEWDSSLSSFFRIPLWALPDVRSSSEVYTSVSSGPLQGVPISGCLGDQQAALLGQNCLRPGMAKITYGTGCFLLCHTGPKPVLSSSGLLTTVAYKLGPKAIPAYALEGSVAVAGAVVSWLRDRLRIVKDIAEVERLAASVSDSDEVLFVPAFGGLLAPHWRPDARGVVCGLTYTSSREHVCRAALEAVALQTREVADAMTADSGLEMSSVLVDGGMSSCDLLMQLQADLLGVQVLRPSMPEASAFGAAVAAGSAEGIEVWDSSSIGEIAIDRFLPRLANEARDVKFERWKEAVERSLNWAQSGERRTESRATWRLHASIAPAIFLFTSLIVCKLAGGSQR